jgi:hypothetical protein
VAELEALREEVAVRNRELQEELASFHERVSMSPCAEILGGVHRHQSHCLGIGPLDTETTVLLQVPLGFACLQVAQAAERRTGEILEGPLAAAAQLFGMMASAAGQMRQGLPLTGEMARIMRQVVPLVENGHLLQSAQP